jgi:hypothetical protein
MKKISLILICLINCFISNTLNAQNKNGGTVAAAIGGIVAAGLITSAVINSIEENLEKSMLEWIYTNKQVKDNTQFELKLLDWAANKSDINNVSVISFIYKEKDKPTKIYLYSVTPGWYGDNAVNMNYTKVYEISKELWDNLMLSYLKMSKSELVTKAFDLNTIPTQVSNNKDIVVSNIKDISNITGNQIEFLSISNKWNSYKFEFKKLENSNTHIIKNFDNEFMLDFYDGNLNIFLKSSQKLIRVRRNAILNICKALYN